MTKSRFCVLAMAMLSVTCNVVSSAAAAEPLTVLSVKRMCCAKESVPAIKELSKVPGVGRVSVDYKARTLSIEPTAVAPSPRAIWEAAERVKIEPIRLSMQGSIYTTKPTR